jgi:peptidoglycan-associated lipoprotein
MLATSERSVQNVRRGWRARTALRVGARTSAPAPVGRVEYPMTKWSLGRLVFVFATVAVLSTGCALFGGSDEEDGGGDGSEFDTGGTGWMGDSGTDLGSGVSVPELEAVYFDYDRAVIRDDQKPTLRGNSSAIVSRNEWRTIVVEGHCDERGSEEYNLALGERRANSVKQYLANLGVPGGRMDTVSFGESKPTVQGHDESAWKWNRRAEFRVIR